MVRTLVFQSNNVGSIPAGPIPKCLLSTETLNSYT